MSEHVLRGGDGPDPKWVSLEDAAREQGFALVPLDRVKTIQSTFVVSMHDEEIHVAANLERVMRGIGQDIAQQLQRHQKFRTIESNGMRTYITQFRVVVPTDEEIEGAGK